MAVRAKFKVDSYESILYMQKVQAAQAGAESSTDKYETVEMRTIKMSPVYASNDQNHENYKFWRSSPSGSLHLGCVNKEVWPQFELGKEYYIDFTPAQ